MEIGYTSHPNRIPLKYVFGGGEMCWEISESITYVLTNGETIIVPKGFRTDLASVPKLFRSVINTYGDFLHGVIVHDWIYKTDYKRAELGDYKGRLFADREFLFLANKFNPNKIETKAMYLGIRLGGAPIYKRKYVNLKKN